MKITIPLEENVLAPLGITAAALAIGLRTSGNRTSIISNEEMNDIIKIIKALENSNILIKGVTKTIKNEIKEQKGEFLWLLLGILGVSLLGNY